MLPRIEIKIVREESRLWEKNKKRRRKEKENRSMGKETNRK